MRLSQLITYDDIVIQCHNVPDADALASAFGVYEYLIAYGKNPAIVYSGRSPISKPDLLEMIRLLGIPVQHLPVPPPAKGLLVLVDCQYGGGNATPITAETLCVLDHHDISTELPELSSVRANLASCSTLVWDLLLQEGVNPSKALMTALHYGLYVDSRGFERVTHPLDRDLRDAPGSDKQILTILKNSILTLQDLSLTASALGSFKHYPEDGFLTLNVPPCEPNLLGIISDLAMQTHGVDLVLAFSDTGAQIQFSVRSTTRELKAGDVAKTCAGKEGSGGGDMCRAGGRIPKSALEPLSPDKAVENYLADLVCGYMRNYQIVDCAQPETLRLYRQGKNVVRFADFSRLGLYEKRDIKISYVPSDSILPEGGQILIRMLEGDIYTKVDAHTYLIIGIEGEVYPITKTTFDSAYIPLPDRAPAHDLDYSPVVQCAEKGIRADLAGPARACLSRGGKKICATPLIAGLKLFTLWDSENYIQGEPGDWLVFHSDAPDDWYVVKRAVFPKLYAPAHS